MLIQDLDGPMLDGTDGAKDKKASVVSYFMRTFRLELQQTMQHSFESFVSYLAKMLIV